MNHDKLRRARDVLASLKCDALWVRHRSHLAWLTDGARPYIHTACDTGVFSLLVTADTATVLTYDMERRRLFEEEGLAAWACTSVPWQQPLPQPYHLIAGTRVAADLPEPGMVDAHLALLACRAGLDAVERRRYAELGNDASQALYRAARELRPGMSEHAIAGAVAGAMYAVGALPVVLLVAADARIRSIRHPLPTSNPLQRTAMLVVCAERHGLVASLTRFVCFGPPDAAVTHALYLASRVDAAALCATRPLTPLREIWRRMLAVYAAVGHPDSWQGLHQGGPCSYAPRDFFAQADSTEQVHLHQAFAWNPSVPGGKSEDTVLVHEDGLEVLTRGPWPTQEVPDGQNGTVARPTVLRLD